MKIRTKRLTIQLASNDEMKQIIDNEQDEEMKAAYSEMLDGCLTHPEQIAWYAVWMMKLEDETMIGDLCFKGLDADGTVEIGYGVQPEYKGKGFATEAVSELTKWASEQPGVKNIEAETDPDNIASQRVLAKAGFVENGKMGEEGPRFVWINDKR